MVDWYSGSGAGGQHRNKHQNCCRITHTESGLSAVGTSSRSRVANQEEAFKTLAKKVLQYYYPDDNTPELATTVVRTYSEPRNEVKDNRTGSSDTYKNVVIRGDISKFVGES